MAYNPFRWYTSGKYRKRPLKSSAPLLLRIRNGDFEYSPFFLEAGDNNKLYDEMYQYYMDTSPIKNLHDKTHEAHQYAKMKRIKAQKLMEKGMEEEQTRLHQLKKNLNLSSESVCGIKHMKDREEREQPKIYIGGIRNKLRWDKHHQRWH
jgi:hypothetical protein